ncbi:MAG TPA: Ig domain-containing protein [Acidimicrobiales bacterium]|nr:Ig domain-containing protein [Acidimicrobiales bacterium]
MFAIVLAVALSLVLPGVLSQQSAQAAVRHPKTPSTLTFHANGYFQVAKKGRHWYFVTPQGAPFYAAAIDTVTAQGDIDQTTGQCPYCQAVAANYPNLAAWDSTTLSRLRSWGVTTLGSFSDYQSLGSQMPYEVSLSMASGNDWFEPSFVTHADQVAATQVAPLANDPNVVGFFTDTEITWGPPNIPDTLLDEYMRLPAGSPGLAVAQQYAGNPSGFLFALATRYFQVTTAAIRQYDPNHLILGVKAEGQEIQPQLLEAARPYVDVFSLEDYELQPGLASLVHFLYPYYLPVQANLADFYKYAKRPLLIGEYAFIATGPQDPNTHPGIYLLSPDQQSRATAFENYIAPLYENAPWVVGDSWFEWFDEPAGGRPGDNENDNFGMVNIQDQPYPTMVSAMQLMHSVISSRVVQPGSQCGSWTNSGGGVTCNVVVPGQTYPIAVVTTTLPAGVVGQRYSSAVYAGGGRPPYHYSIVNGSLPPGLRFSGRNDSISGTPRQAGTFSFTVHVADSAGSVAATQMLSISVT